jgi:hypothetical protein
MLFSDYCAKFSFKNADQLSHQCVNVLVLQGLFQVFKNKTYGIGFFARTQFAFVFEYVEQVHLFQHFLGRFSRQLTDIAKDNRLIDDQR